MRGEMGRFPAAVPRPPCYRGRESCGVCNFGGTLGFLSRIDAAGQSGTATGRKPIANKTLHATHRGPAVFAGTGAAGTLKLCEV